ncbi:thioredoxin family protein [Sagittula salina]
MSIRGIVSVLAATVLCVAPAFASDIALVMVEQRGCAYCAAWDDEIAPAYPNTAEGRYAPLERADLHMGPPDGISYARRVNFTPTFILVTDGQEVARMEGYVGQDFFWPLFSKLLETNTDFVPQTN